MEKTIQVRAKGDLLEDCTEAKIAKYTVENKIPAAAIHHFKKKTGCKNKKHKLF